MGELVPAGGGVMPRGLAHKTRVLIAQSASILAEIQPATVRAVCYRLFVQGAIASMAKGDTDKVSKALTTARERGLVPWAWIVDETRRVERDASWDDPAAFMGVVRRSYRKDRWVEQPQRLLVASEKATVGGTLRPVLDTYGVGFLVLHGFGSATALHDLAAFSAGDPRPLTLLYVGDHDPSGRHMSDVDIPRRLAQYGGQGELVRLAVTPEQIAGFGLQTFAATTKSKDARYRWFLERHGEACCELDALDPNALRRLVETVIVARLDWETWTRAERVERAEMESLGAFLLSWPGAA
jgi:hypothetical protein